MKHGFTPETKEDMILAAPLPAAPLANKLTTNLKNYSRSSSTTKTTHLSSLNSSFSIAAFSLRRSWGQFCTEKENAHDLFDDFSVLSSDIPWDSQNIWSTFAAYFFILHIPLSYGGLSITTNILHQAVLDPLTMVGSALVLQMTEIVGAMALLHYTAKPQYTFSNFIIEMWSSEKRNWLKASALGIGFLIGLVLLTSAVADRLVGPKDVNNPILKEILLYSPASRTACLFLYCLVSPLLEELVYRGFLLRSLCSKMKWWQAVVISSCIFSIAHFSSENSVQLVLIGAVLGSAHCWTGSLAAPFTIHFVYNATILLATIMSKT